MSDLLEVVAHFPLLEGRPHELTRRRQDILLPVEEQLEGCLLLVLLDRGLGKAFEVRADWLSIVGVDVQVFHPEQQTLGLLFHGLLGTGFSRVTPAEVSAHAITFGLELFRRIELQVFGLASINYALPRFYQLLLKVVFALVFVVLAVELGGLTSDLDQDLPELAEAFALLVDFAPVQLRAYFEEHLEEHML
jgi:hypothetical protein